MRLIPHRLLSLKSMLLTGLLFLTACPTGGGTPSPPTDSLQLAGTYNGQFVIANSNPFVDVKTTFKIDAAGNVSGTTTPSNINAAADNGTIQGTIRGGNAYSLEFNLQFESPAMGKYAMTGKGIYSSLSKDLAGDLTAKNSAGTFVGNAPFPCKKE
jgi:hypothetical protein